MKPKLSARQDLYSCEHTVNVRSGESQKEFKKKTRKQIGWRLIEEKAREEKIARNFLLLPGFLQQHYLRKRQARDPISDLIKVCRLMATKADQAEPGAKTGVTVWNLDKKPAGTMCPPQTPHPETPWSPDSTSLKEAKRSGKSYSIWRERKTMEKKGKRKKKSN